MTTVNHECYVSLEVAELLKEAGFDWEIRSLYDEQNNFVCSLYRDWNNVTICKSAPTLEVAQRWLREVKGLYVTVDYFSDSWREHGYPFFEWKVRSEILGPLACITGQRQTYEEAQEAGIKNALELILEKGE